MLRPAEKAADVKGRTLKRFNGVFFDLPALGRATGLVGSSLVLVLVQSNSATTYLFLGLSACTIASFVGIIALLPPLPPISDDASSSAAAIEQQGDPTIVASSSIAPPDDKPKKEDDVTILSTLHLCLDLRMALIAPNILYNGLSLGYAWFFYNTFVFNTALGTSFVGFGAALGYLANAISTTTMSKIASRYGQLVTMIVATFVQAAFYVLMLWYHVEPLNAIRVAAVMIRAGRAGGCRQQTEAAPPFHRRRPLLRVQEPSRSIATRRYRHRAQSARRTRPMPPRSVTARAAGSNASGSTATPSNLRWST